MQKEYANKYIYMIIFIRKIVLDKFHIAMVTTVSSVNQGTIINY